MYSILNKIRQVFPTACPLCAMPAAGADLCDGCHRDLWQGRQTQAACRQCGGSLAHKLSSCGDCRRRLPAFALTVAAISFSYPGDLLIRGFKERGQLAHAGLFARMLSRAMSMQVPALPALQALVPIPSGHASLRKRGFNPAAELARELCRSTRIPLRQGWLRRTREASLQKTLNSAARRKSVEGLYACDESIPACWVGVVDDVMTSGSTLHQAALVLRQAGALGVVALVAARTPRGPEHAEDTRDSLA